MKRAKKLIWLLVTAAMFAAAPLTAMALPAGGYVPTAGTSYYKDDANKWVKDEKISYSYKKDGRLTKITRKYTGGTYSTAFTWKGNYITKISGKGTYGEGSYSGSSSSATTYKYKNKKLTSYQYSGNKAQKIKWKGKTGTETVTWNGGSATYKYTINGKGQLVKYTGKVKEGGTTTTFTNTCKYYGNGNLKSITYKGKGYSTVEKYNQKGYITSRSYKFDSSTSKTTYKYKTQKGKLKEVVMTTTAKGEGYSDKSSNKIVFTKWKNVSHIRLCDAWGRIIRPW